jgi:hypothetical protein
MVRVTGFARIITAVSAPCTPPALWTSARERAALEWTEALTLVSATRVQDEVYDRVREQWFGRRVGAPGPGDRVDELDVEGILAFAERILPRASDLWVQASLDYKQRLQQLFFPEGVAFDGNRFNRTAVTAPLFKYLAPSESADERVARQPKLEGARGPPSRPSSQHAMADNLRPEPERRLVSHT